MYMYISLCIYLYDVSKCFKFLQQMQLNNNVQQCPANLCGINASSREAHEMLAWHLRPPPAQPDRSRSVRSRSRRYTAGPPSNPMALPMLRAQLGRSGFGLSRSHGMPAGHVQRAKRCSSSQFMNQITHSTDLLSSSAVAPENCTLPFVGITLQLTC